MVQSLGPKQCRTIYLGDRHSIWQARILQPKMPTCPSLSHNTPPTPFPFAKYTRPRTRCMPHTYSHTTLTCTSVSDTAKAGLPAKLTCLKKDTVCSWQLLTVHVIAISGPVNHNSILSASLLERPNSGLSGCSAVSRSEHVTCHYG